jgi:hypothetical protein
MRKELGLLNIICLLVVLGFLAMAVISVLGSGDFLTIDNLFIITVCLVMALMFAVPFLTYLYQQGKLPVPFLKRKAPAPSLPAGTWGASGSAQVRAAASTPPLLDAKGRAVPPDVKAIMNRMGSQTGTRDA